MAKWVHVGGPHAHAPEDRCADEPDLDPGSITDMPDKAPPGSWQDLSDLFGDAWELVEQGARKTGELLADGLVTMVGNAELVAFTFGEWSGWLLTLGLIEFFTHLAFAKLGVWLAKGGAWLAKTVAATAKLDGVLLRLAGPLKSVAGIVDDALEQALALCKAIHMPFVDELIGVLGKLKTSIATFFDDLLEKLEAWAAILIKRRKEGQKRRKNQGDDPNGVPGGKPGNGKDDKEDKGDRSKARKVADKVFEKAAPDEGDALISESSLSAKLRRPKALHREAQKAKLDHSGRSTKWRVTVTSAHGKATSDAGWVGYSEKNAPFFGEESAADANQEEANEVFDDLEKAWQAIFDDMDHDDEKKALAELAHAMRQEDREHEAQLAYANMDLVLNASDKVSWEGEYAEVDVDLAISPNTFRDGTTLSANPEGRAEQFEKIWPGVVDEAFAAELREPWVAAVSEAASKGEFDFHWPTHYEKADGANEVKADLKEWLLGDRKRSKNTWEDRLLAELKTTTYRIPFMAPTVKSAQAFLDTSIKDKGLEESWRSCPRGAPSRPSGPGRSTKWSASSGTVGWRPSVPPGPSPAASSRAIGWTGCSRMAVRACGTPTTVASNAGAVRPACQRRPPRVARRRCRRPCGQHPERAVDPVPGSPAASTRSEYRPGSVVVCTCCEGPTASTGDASLRQVEGQHVHHTAFVVGVGQQQHQRVVRRGAVALDGVAQRPLLGIHEDAGRVGFGEVPHQVLPTERVDGARLRADEVGLAHQQPRVPLVVDQSVVGGPELSLLGAADGGQQRAVLAEDGDATMGRVRPGLAGHQLGDAVAIHVCGALPEADIGILLPEEGAVRREDESDLHGAPEGPAVGPPGIEHDGLQATEPGRAIARGGGGAQIDGRSLIRTRVVAGSGGHVVRPC